VVTEGSLSWYLFSAVFTQELNFACTLSGAESLGYSAAAHGMFPEGGVILAHYLYSSLNQRLAEDLKAQNAAAEADGTPLVEF
jgi:hypothetical protein